MEKTDYKSILAHILWCNCVKNKNKESGFFEIVGEPNEWNRGDSFPKGSLLEFEPNFLSYAIPDYVPLTWKELSLKLGLNVQYLVDDGHCCIKCPNHNNCHAYFKNDPQQNICNYWCHEVDDTIYQANLEKYSVKD